MNLQEEFL